MKQLSIVIPALIVEPVLVEQKLMPLLTAVSEPAQLVIHAPSPNIKRNYFFETEEANKAKQAYKTEVKNWCDTLSKLFEQHAVAYEMTIVWQRRLDEEHFPQMAASKEALMVMVMPQADMMHGLRSLLRREAYPVLVLQKAPWHGIPRILAAVDPLHESDNAQARDISIVKQAKALAKTIGGKAAIVHSCFVPAYLLSYKAKLLSIHRSNLEEFVSDNQFSGLSHSLIQGEPENSLRRYAKEQGTDVMILGSVARGLFDRFMLGGTAESLLADPPCDLLLIHS